MQNDTSQPSSASITITPFLVVSNAAKAAEFYINGFGATELDRYEISNTQLGIKLAIGNAAFFISDEEPEFNNLSPQTIGGSPVRLVITVADPDALFNQAIAAGATQICPVTTEADWRIGKLTDPYGHTWEIGCQL